MTQRFPTLTDTACIGVGLIIIALGAGIAVAGPDVVMPVHWGLNGQVDRYGSRFEVGATIGFMGAMLALIGGGIGWFVPRADDPARARGLRLSQLLILVTLTAVTAFMASTMLGQVLSLSLVLPMAGLSLLFLIIGAYLGRVPPNPVMGVRTPWTYKSRRAWDRSNRLAGRLFFLIGLVGLLTCGFVPQPSGFITLISAVIAAALLSIFESWRVWRTDPDRQPF